jgi:mono/diheme cytochrome c family protein
MKNTIRFAETFETLIGILATTLIVVGVMLYVWNEPDRIVMAQEEQLALDLDEAMTLYAENCSVCHGIAGEGISSTPPLNSPALRDSDYASLDKVISRGLFNTAMPAWSVEDGGPLSTYQISELVSLIQSGDWVATQDRVVNLGLAPMVPFASEPDQVALEQLVGIEGGDLLVQGVELYAQECVACHGADGLGTSLAPPLNDPAVRGKEAEELKRTILNGVSGTLMAPWGNTLSDDEVNALVALITNWDQVPSGAIPLPDKQLSSTEESLALGSELYSSSCARCHGPEGQGTQRAPALNVKGFLEETSDVAIQQIVTQGVPGTSMPAWGDRLMETEIQAIVGFIRSWEPNAPEVAEPARGGGPWWQSDSNTTPGGGRGGPPWMRNNSDGVGSGSALPSGGSSQSTDQGQETGPNIPAQGVSGHAGPPDWAGQMSGQAGETITDDHASQAVQQLSGSDPASLQSQADEATFWKELDWRIAVILGGILTISLVLIGFAWSKLRRFSLPDLQA